MSDETVFFDDAVDGAEDSSVAVADNDGAGSSQDSFGDMQDRMSGDDDLWYSSSEGKVVDKDGNIITDPKTGKEFSSMEDYSAWKNQQSQPTAKPKTEQEKNVKPAPMSKSFDMYAKGDGELTPEKFQELHKVGSSYKYSDDLLPKINPVAKTAENQPVDPIEKVREDRKNWEAIAINPINAIREKLIANGIDQVALDELLAEDIQKQKQLVETQYQSAIEKAQLEKVEGMYKPQLTKLEQEKVTSTSNANIDSLAKAYFPQGGKDQYYALINGYKGEDGNFVRGPAAQLLDFAVSLATNGKEFSNEQERASAYQDTHSKITANPAMAKVLFDLAYTHWLGKNAGEAKKIGFNDGRKAAMQESQRVNKTIKTKPASYQSPGYSDDDKDAPQLLRAAMGRR